MAASIATPGRTTKDVDVRLLLFESFGGFGKGGGEILWKAANVLQNKLTLMCRVAARCVGSQIQLRNASGASEAPGRSARRPSLCNASRASLRRAVKGSRDREHRTTSPFIAFYRQISRGIAVAIL